MRNLRNSSVGLFAALAAVGCMKTGGESDAQNLGSGGPKSPTTPLKIYDKDKTDLLIHRRGNTTLIAQPFGDLSAN